jgi:Tol biopolymer transport system component
VSRTLALTLVLAAGCRFSPPGASDAPVELIDAPAEGMPDPSKTCMERWRAGTVNLGTPALITSLMNPTVDRDPFLSADELTIYFSSDRLTPGSEDIFAATRASLSMPFGTPVGRSDISSGDSDSRFTTSSSGLIGVVASNRANGEGDSDLWLAIRANQQDLFSMISQSTLGDVNESGAELDPELSADGLHLYLAQNSPGNRQRIVVADRPTLNAEFESPEDVEGVNSDMGDADPSLSPDELVIVFASLRGGNGDIYYASRDRSTDEFRTPNPVLGVNTSFDDGDPTLSADGCRLYFASVRTGNWEIYVASMAPP